MENGSPVIVHSLFIIFSFFVHGFTIGVSWIVFSMDFTELVSLESPEIVSSFMDFTLDFTGLVSLEIVDIAEMDRHG